MEQSPLRLIKRCSEYIPIGEINRMPPGPQGGSMFCMTKGQKWLMMWFMSA